MYVFLIAVAEMPLETCTRLVIWATVFSNGKY